MIKTKFKIWNEKCKRMLYDSSLAIKGNQIIEELGTKVIQYIGLKDQNGKELYVTDFVDFTYTNSDGQDIETSGVIELDLKHTAGYILREIGTNAIIGLTVTDFRNMRKVGNSYENPELLK